MGSSRANASSEGTAQGVRLHAQPTVDLEHVAVDVAGVVAGQERYGGGHIARFAEETQRDVGEHSLANIIGQGGCHSVVMNPGATALTVMRAVQVLLPVLL